MNEIPQGALSKEALELLKRRDPDAVNDFVLAHHRQMRAYIASLSTDLNTVDDLAQEVFIRALEHIGEARDLSNFGAFLRGIARNVLHEFHRRRAAPSEDYVRFVEETFAAKDHGRPSAAEHPEALKALRHCTDKLTERSRQMLRLRYFEEKQAAEIGEELGLQGGAVRIALLRIRETLLKCIRSITGGSASEALS